MRVTFDPQVSRYGKKYKRSSKDCIALRNVRWQVPIMDKSPDYDCRMTADVLNVLSEKAESEIHINPESRRTGIYGTTLKLCSAIPVTKMTPLVFMRYIDILAGIPEIPSMIDVEDETMKLITSVSASFTMSLYDLLGTDPDTRREAGLEFLERAYNIMIRYTTGYPLSTAEMKEWSRLQSMYKIRRSTK